MGVIEKLDLSEEIDNLDKITKISKRVGKTDWFDVLLQMQMADLMDKWIGAKAKELEAKAKETDMQANMVATTPNLTTLGALLEWIKTLPEADRPLAIQLATAMMQPKIVQGSAATSSNDLMPLLAMIMLLNKNDNKNNDDTTLKLLLEYIRSNTQERIEMIKSLADAIAKNAKGGSNDAIIEAMKEITKPTQNFADKLYELVMAIALGGEKKEKGDELDRLLELIAKLQDVGLITSPEAMLEWRKHMSQLELERYKIDKEFELQREQIERDREQMEKASEFLAELAEALSSVAEKENAPEQKPAFVEKPCPKCGNMMKIPVDIPDGTKIKCANCGAVFEIHRKESSEKKGE